MTTPEPPKYRIRTTISQKSPNGPTNATERTGYPLFREHFPIIPGMP
jgi:hypothetical protein